MNRKTAKRQDIVIISKDRSIPHDIELDFNMMKRAAMILRAVNHSLRQSIIRLLEENHSLTVTEIYVKLRLEQSVASQHLAILRRSGFLKTQRDGKYIYYSLNKTRISEIMDLVQDLVV